MKSIVMGIVLAALALVAVPRVDAQAQELQQKLAAAKQSAALNQKALRSYSWLEKTELSLKGEVKNTKVDMCKYGPDGKVQKTPVVEPEPAEKKRGLRGKVVAKKTGEMKEELEAAVALVQQYVPPSPDLMQVVMNSGTASISQAGPGAAALKFPGYVKKGDALTLTFDSTVKALRQMEVNTWLDEPENAVNLKVTMQSMPDGISYPGTIVFELPKRQLEVKITKSNYQKIAQ
jgi:type II secretory pathway pseudopilin PulG